MVWTMFVSTLRIVIVTPGMTACPVSVTTPVTVARSACPQAITREKRDKSKGLAKRKCDILIPTFYRANPKLTLCTVCSRDNPEWLDFTFGFQPGSSDGEPKEGKITNCRDRPVLGLFFAIG